jgi:thiol-disulfide isomerase/thioredoxin
MSNDHHLGKFILSISWTWWILASSPFPSTAFATDDLEVGTLAPALDISHWVHDGNGKYPKVSTFETGKVYVIEFWATTCGPCIQSIPHLAELQTKYGDRGMQIISVSDETVDVVAPFLNNRIKNSKGQVTTINDVARSYCLTCDPDGSTSKDYLLAANQSAIPCAFIVGKDARIEWIGHPLEMDSILEAVLNGRWDRDAHIAEQKLVAEIQSAIGPLMRRKEYSQVATVLQKYIDRAQNKRTQFDLLKSKVDVLLLAKVGNEEIEKSYAALFASCSEDPMFVQDAAWSAFEKYSEGELSSREVIRMSANAVENAIVRVRGAEQANMYDTFARLQYAIGNLDLAIIAQTNAVRLSDGTDQGSFREFLLELTEAKNKSTAKD